MVDLELYRLFITVANEENITKASWKLHISQPAISKQIHNLENELHITLFERSNTGVKLTSDGEKLYNKIKDAIFLLEHAEDDFDKNRIIRLGTRNTILSKIFSKGLNSFYHNFPNNTIDIQLLEIDEMLNRLNNNLLDIVLTKKIENDNLENIKFIKLGKLHDVFITKKGSNHAKKVFSLDELKNHIIYTNSIKSKAVSTTILKNLFKIDDLNNLSNIKPVTTNTIISLLKDEDAIGFITKEFIDEELNNNQLDIVTTNFEIPSTDYGIYYNKNNRFQVLDDLINCIKNNCTQI